MARLSATRRRDGFVLHMVIVPLALIWLFPLWIMMVYSTFPDSGIFNPGVNLIPSTRFANNLTILQEETGFIRTVINSFVVAAVYMVLSVFLTSMAGWALARYRFFGRRIVTFLVLGTMSLPYLVVVIPQFVMVAREFGLANTWFALIVPPLFNSLGVLFMRQAFKMMPSELFDAARVDGASEWKIFFFVALPIAKPTIAALRIILFLASWNNYLWPLLINTQADMMTGPVALGSLIGTTHVSWGGIMAGSVTLTLPMLVLFVLLQRYFISGITAGSIK